MAENNRRESKQIVYSSDEELSIRLEKTKEKQTTTATITANSTINGNFACSPLSLDISLGMLAAGAEGETLKQLLVFLGHESVDNFLSQSPSSILLK
ncbi:serpin-ZX [Tanacetum coccineum]